MLLGDAGEAILGRAQEGVKPGERLTARPRLGRMRIQYAVVCHEFQDGHWFGVTNLIGVCHKLVAPVQPSEDGELPVVPLTLVVSLIDGAVGRHKVWVAVRDPRGEVSTTLPPLEIDWDEESPTFFTIFEVPLRIAGSGVYEFNILVDGEPVGSTPLPVEVAPPPGGPE